MLNHRKPQASCPCCNSTEWLRRWPGFVICRSCGMMTVEAIYSTQDLERFYQEDYFQGREYIDYLGDKASQQKTLAYALRTVQRHVLPGGRILEIGCAYGFFLELIAAIYPNSVGIDVSSVAVSHARRQGLDARQGDLLEMELSERFDAVCLWDTIEHLAKPVEVLERASHALRPGGYLFLTTGDFGSLVARLQGLRWRQIHPPTHLFYFTRPALQAMCGRIGFVALEFKTTRVYRRLGSALEALNRFHAQSLSGRCARLGLRTLSNRLLNWDVPLSLDTVCLTARMRSDR